MRSTRNPQARNHSGGSRTELIAAADSHAQVAAVVNNLLKAKLQLSNRAKQRACAYQIV